MLGAGVSEGVKQRSAGKNDGKAKYLLIIFLFLF